MTTRWSILSRTTEDDPHRPMTNELDPRDEPERWERLVGAIVEAAEPHLAARRRTEVLAVVAAWAKPAVLTAAAIGALIAGTARLMVTDRPGLELQNVSLFDSLMPEAYAAWLSGERSPSADELIASLEEWKNR